MLEALRERTGTMVGSGRELILNSDKKDAGDGNVSSKHSFGCAGFSVLVVKPGQVVFNANKGDKDHLWALREAVPEEYNVVAHISERKNEMIRLRREQQKERKASRKKNPKPASSLATPAKEESLLTKALAPDDLTSSNQRKRKATITVSGKKDSRTDTKIATNVFHDAKTNNASTSPMAEPVAGPRNDVSPVLDDISNFFQATKAAAPIAEAPPKPKQKRRLSKKQLGNISNSFQAIKAAAPIVEALSKPKQKRRLSKKQLMDSSSVCSHSTVSRQGSARSRRTTAQT